MNDRLLVFSLAVMLLSLGFHLLGWFTPFSTITAAFASFFAFAALILGGNSR